MAGAFCRRTGKNWGIGNWCIPMWTNNRSPALSGVSLPDGTLRILIQSRTNIDGWSGDLFELILQK